LKNLKKFLANSIEHYINMQPSPEFGSNWRESWLNHESQYQILPFCGVGETSYRACFVACQFCHVSKDIVGFDFITLTALCFLPMFSSGESLVSHSALYDPCGLNYHMSFQSGLFQTR
jgi:hypothetical protein